MLEVQRRDGSGVRLTDWLTRCTERLRGVSEPVRRKYHAYIRNDIAPFFGDTTVDAVTQDLDAAWIVYLEQEKGNAPKTIHNKHGFLSGGLRAATLERPEPLIAYNPCTGTRLPATTRPNSTSSTTTSGNCSNSCSGSAGGRWRSSAWSPWPGPVRSSPYLWVTSSPTRVRCASARRGKTAAAASSSASPRRNAACVRYTSRWRHSTGSISIVPATSRCSTPSTTRR